MNSIPDIVVLFFRHKPGNFPRLACSNKEVNAGAAMSSPQSLQSSQAVLQRLTTSPVADDARSIYRCLMEKPTALTSQRMAHSFLKRQLDSAAQLPSSLPTKPEAFTSWVERGALDVA